MNYVTFFCCTVDVSIKYGSVLGTKGKNCYKLIYKLGMQDKTTELTPVKGMPVLHRGDDFYLNTGSKVSAGRTEFPERRTECPHQ